MKKKLFNHKSNIKENRILKRFGISSWLRYIGIGALTQEKTDTLLAPLKEQLRIQKELDEKLFKDLLLFGKCQTHISKIGECSYIEPKDWKENTYTMTKEEILEKFPLTEQEKKDLGIYD